MLHFDINSTTACVNVNITNDKIAEEEKVFQLFLSRTTDLDRRIKILNTLPGRLFLEDDDGM